MPSLLLLIVCLGFGVILRQSARLPANAHVVVNGIILNLSLPALTLHYLHDFRVVAGDLLPVAMPWILFAFGAGVFFAIGRALRLPRATVGALILVGGLGNTSFVGLPMIESLYGTSGIPLGLLIDQMGSYLALSTLGVLTATCYASATRKSNSEICRRIFTFPPFFALVLALLTSRIVFPAALSEAIARIGDTVAPLALLSVGLQLRLTELGGRTAALAMGLGYKLLACPALIFAVLWFSNASGGMASQVSLIESAMPPMMGAGILAIDAELDPGLVSLMIGLGIPMAFLTAPAWNWLYCNTFS